MSHTYHIGDLHIGHRSVCKYRTMFSSVEEHNETLVSNILSTVNKRDTLWLHGDLFFSPESLNSALEIVERCCTVNIILGNHDSDRKIRREIIKTLVDCQNVKLHSLVSKYGAWLSHHPLHPAELRGKFNIHGHVHYQTIREPGYFNVSAENLGFFPRKTEDIMNAAKDNDFDRWV